MTARTSLAANHEDRKPVESQRPAEPTNLTFLYGTIGIQAVAAAARYNGVRKGAPSVHIATRIDQRFVESAG